MPDTHPKNSVLVEALRRVPLFTDLSDSELSTIADRATLHHYNSGEMIFAEGDACSELLIVQQGSVKLIKIAANGRCQLLSMERAGSPLSELSVFDGNPYPATAEATTPVTLVRLEAGHFRQICRQSPEVALKVIKVLGHRLRRMGGLIENLSFSTVRGRLVAYLVQLADEQGRPTTTGIQVGLLENNQELAARLGTVRELVSRTLGRLHNEGLIEVRCRLVTIRSLAALKREMSTG